MNGPQRSSDEIAVEASPGRAEGPDNDSFYEALEATEIVDSAAPPGFCTSAAEFASEALAFALMSGVPPEDIAHLTGLSPREISSEGVVPDDIPPRILRTVLERGLASAPAIEMARTSAVRVFGKLDIALPYAPTPYDAIRLNVEFADRYSERAVIRTEESENFVAVHHFHPCDLLDNGMMHEVALLKTWWMIRSLMGRHAHLTEVSLGFSSNATSEAYEEAFGRPVSFERYGPEHTLVFRKEDLKVESVGGNPNLFNLGKLYLQEQSQLHGRRVVPRKMRHLQSTITACVARGVFDVKQVAKAAFMSVRSAQRIASVQGTTMSKLIERSRLEHARTLILADPQISNAKLAEGLGYNDERSLNRAFKRRTGFTPTQFKRFAREED